MASNAREGTGEPREEIGLVTPLPGSGPSGLAIAFALAALGIGLFAFLEARRSERPRERPAQTAAEGTPLTSAPPLEVPQPPPARPAPPAPSPAPRIQYVEAAPPPPTIKYIDRPQAGAPPPPPQAIGKQAEPPLVIDLGQVAAAQPAQGDDATARAIVLKHRALLVQQGTLIPAVLETPIDSTRPGLVRAITSADTRGFDGTRVLIPRGSRLVGDYKSDVLTGQKRVLVTWTRLVRPDGVAIRLASPASDTVGGAGVAGAVNDHFFARVASVALQSALTIGVNLASNPNNGSVVVQAPLQGVAGAGQAMLPLADLKPTITVREGAAITVFVARDLDFTGALPQR